jgi:LysR family transcriptional regulator, glycine cleavage system transcriptional activator
MVTSKSLIDAGRLVVLGDRYLPVLEPEAYYLVYPSRSEDHLGMGTFRKWLLGEADAYCRQMPQLRRDEAAA